MNAPSTIFCLRVKLNLLWFALFENLFIRHDSRYDLFRENAASVVPTADWYTVRCIITRATCLTIDKSSLTHEDDVFWHDSDVMMGTMASQITSLTIVYSTFIRRRSKKTSKFHVTGLCEGNSLMTGEFPAQKASNAENVSIWWRHHGRTKSDLYTDVRFQSLRRCVQ